MAITAGLVVNSQGCSNPIRSGQKASSRQPLPFIRIVPSGVDGQRDGLLEMGGVAVCGL